MDWGALATTSSADWWCAALGPERAALDALAARIEQLCSGGGRKALAKLWGKLDFNGSG